MSQIQVQRISHMFSDLMDSAKQKLDYIDLDSVKHLAEDTWLKTEHIAGEGLDSIRKVINSLDKKTMEEIVAKTWIHLKDMPNSAHDSWNNMDKSEKVAVAALMAGGAVVSVPFLIAAGPLSIVSALALLGGGTITAGGFGVAGGIIVTAAGATLSAALGGYIANKAIEDPDVAKLINAYTELETVIKQNFTIMEKNQARYRDLYRRYGEIANCVAGLIEKIEKNTKWDPDSVKEFRIRIEILLRDLNENLQDK